MTFTESGAQIQKTDTKGRVPTTPERRAELLAEYDKSGLSAMRFAQVTGLNYQTFIGWVQDRRKRQAQTQAGGGGPAVKASGALWLEAVVNSGPLAGAVLRVALPSGAVIELTDVGQTSLAAQLLRAWEKAGC